MCVAVENKSVLSKIKNIFQILAPFYYITGKEALVGITDRNRYRSLSSHSTKEKQNRGEIKLQMNSHTIALPQKSSESPTHLLI